MQRKKWARITNERIKENVTVRDYIEENKKR